MAITVRDMCQPDRKALPGRNLIDDSRPLRPRFQEAAGMAGHFEEGSLPRHSIAMKLLPASEERRPVEQLR